MLDAHFVLPDHVHARRVTQHRLDAINWFISVVEPAVVGLIVTGSMAYGRYWSVTEQSDIDVQLLLTPESCVHLLDIPGVDKEQLQHMIDGYRDGIYEQFSFDVYHDNIRIECHCWDADAFYDLISGTRQSVLRYRSTDTPAVDYGFSLTGSHQQTYTAQPVGGYLVSEFPSSRTVEGETFFCRPITNMIASPLVVIGNPDLQRAMATCWQQTMAELDATEPEAVLAIIGARNKLSPAATAAITTRAAWALS